MVGVATHPFTGFAFFDQEHPPTAFLQSQQRVGSAYFFRIQFLYLHQFLRGFCEPFVAAFLGVEAVKVGYIPRREHIAGYFGVTYLHCQRPPFKLKACKLLSGAIVHFVLLRGELSCPLEDISVDNVFIHLQPPEGNPLCACLHKTSRYMHRIWSECLYMTVLDSFQLRDTSRSRWVPGSHNDKHS